MYRFDYYDELSKKKTNIGVIVAGGTPLVTDSLKPVTTVTTASPVVDKSPSTTVVATTAPKTPATISALNSPQPIVKLVKLSTSTAITTSCDITNNQEQIVEKAKQVIIELFATKFYNVIDISFLIIYC